MGNHHPIFLHFPYGGEPPPPFVRKIEVGGLSEEEWAERGRAIGDLLATRGHALCGFLG